MNAFYPPPPSPLIVNALHREEAITYTRYIVLTSTPGCIVFIGETRIHAQPFLKDLLQLVARVIKPNQVNDSSPC